MKDLAVWRLQRLKARKAPGTLKERVAKDLGLIPKEITVVFTDVQGSTDLWEQFPLAMSAALDLHDALLRSLLKKFYGYEVTTEGDSFTLAFHEAIDAIAFSIRLQEELMDVAWPEDLLLSPHACPDTSAKGDKLFAGLRVRAAIHTGIPDSIKVHAETAQIEYSGEIMEMAECISRLPSGGQILVSGATFQRTFGRLHEIGPQKEVPPMIQPSAVSSIGLRSMQSFGPTRLRATQDRTRISTFFGREQKQNEDAAKCGKAAALSAMPRVYQQRASVVPLSKSVTVIDQGRFALIDFSSQASLSPEDDGLALVEGTSIVEMLPTPLASRALAFATLDNSLKVGPSFFDAPGAELAHLPGGGTQDLEDFSVTIVFCSCCYYKDLAMHSASLAATALMMYKSCVRTTIRLCNGVECQEKEGLFMLAFLQARDAVEWAITLNTALPKVDWGAKILKQNATREIRGSANQVLMRGLPAAIGMLRGHVVSICPHATTGKADYFGATLNRAARIFSAAQPGQVLLEEGLANDVCGEWARMTSGPAKAGPLALRNFHLLQRISDEAHLQGARSQNSQDVCSNLGADLTPMHRENLSLPSTPTKCVHLDSITVSVPSLEAEQQALQPVLAPGAQSRRSIQSESRAALQRSRQGSLQRSVMPRNTDDPEGQASLVQEINARLQQLTPRPSEPSDTPAGAGMQPRTSKTAIIDNAMRSANLAGQLDELPTKESQIEIHSLGTYVFKGIVKPRRIVQILPASISERLTIGHGQLKRGKATCLNVEQVHLTTATVWLPDLSGLQLARQPSAL
ncbi:hypothetical protein WJX84_006381 [Apatococcus fuscideae]|uniref:Guanylate cyclase domain-containing protein n=1 Tax=Apatococcus fuscideae TaxID=2026836 RepID=A0AAW1SQJ0_9CHLO